MSYPSTGRLKIYLGYAAGVGKTYMMLEEARRLRSEGIDLVIGYFEPHGRKDTIALTQGLEFVPLRKVEYRGSVFGEMDTAAVLARQPEMCVVDELPHTNVPGSERAKRWEDVQVLLAHGIDVLTTLNVQHLESLNDKVWQISGVRVRETIPDWVVQQAHEVVMVDLTPRALVHRLERGVVYSPEKAKQALANFFKESTLAALREMALRQTAHVVEIRQEEAPPPAGAPPTAAAGRGPEPEAAAQDRILILLTADPSTAMLIRRGKRVADYLHAECFAVHVWAAGAQPSIEEERAIERHMNFARNLHIETRSLAGEDVPHALVEFARLHRVAQIFLARPKPRRRLLDRRDDLVHRIVRLARDMQVTIVADRGRPQAAASEQAR